MSPSDPPVYLSVPRGPDLERVAAIGFDTPLSTLGLTPGRVDSLAPDDPTGMPLPSGGVNLQLQIDERDKRASWATSSARDPRFGALFVPAVKSTSTVCATLSAQDDLSLPSTSQVNYVVTLTASVALVATDDAGPLFVDSTGLHDAAPALVTKSSGFVDSHGDLWLANNAGPIWHGRYDPVSGALDGAYVENSTKTTALQTLAVVRTASLAEIYGLDMVPPEGALVLRYYDGTSWHEVTRWPAPAKTYRSLAVEPNGEVLVVATLDPPMLRVRHGVIVKTETPPFPNSPTTDAYVPGLGLLIGGLGGEIGLDRGSGQWEILVTGPGFPMRKIVPFRDGFIAINTFGDLVQWSSSARLCPMQSAAGFTVTQMASSRSGLVIGSEGYPTGTRVALIHAK
jgi:hypothetical protein